MTKARIVLSLGAISLLTAAAAAAQVPPVVRAGRATIEGPLTQADIARSTVRHLREVQACAETHGPHDVSLHLSVAATGAVENASVDGDRAFGDCVVAAARSWTFPTATAPSTVTLALSFTAR